MSEHSSPSFGSQLKYSNLNLANQYYKNTSKVTKSDCEFDAWSYHYIIAFAMPMTIKKSKTYISVELLGPCFKTGRIITFIRYTKSISCLYYILCY